MEKVLLAIGDGSEVLDTMAPYYRLGEEYEVIVAAPEKRAYHLVQHELAPDWDITVERPGYRLQIADCGMPNRKCGTGNPKSGTPRPRSDQLLPQVNIVALPCSASVYRVGSKNHEPSLRLCVSAFATLVASSTISSNAETQRRRE